MDHGARRHRATASEGASSPLQESRVSEASLDPVVPNAEGLPGHLGEGGGVTLAVRVGPAGENNRPRVVDLDAGGLVRAQTGGFHMRRDADAEGEVASVDLALPSPLSPVVEDFERGPELVGEIAGVVHHRCPVPVQHAHVTRHFPGRNQVAAAQFSRVDAEIDGGHVHQPVEHEGGLGATGAPHRRVPCLVGEDAEAGHVEVIYGELAAGVGGDVEGEGEPEQVGRTAVLDDAHLESPEAPRRVIRQQRVDDLIPGMAGVGQVLAAVLQPPNRFAEQAGRKRHQQFLCVDTPAEASAHVGCNHPEVFLRASEKLGHVGAQDVWNLSRGPDRQGLVTGGWYPDRAPVFDG